MMGGSKGAVDPLRLMGNGGDNGNGEPSGNFRAGGSGRDDIDEVAGSGVASSRLFGESATTVGELSLEQSSTRESIPGLPGFSLEPSMGGLDSKGSSWVPDESSPVVRASTWDSEMSAGFGKFNCTRPPTIGYLVYMMSAEHA